MRDNGIQRGHGLHLLREDRLQHRAFSFSLLSHILQQKVEVADFELLDWCFASMSSGRTDWIEGGCIVGFPGSRADVLGLSPRLVLRISGLLCRTQRSGLVRSFSMSHCGFCVLVSLVLKGMERCVVLTNLYR